MSCRFKRIICVIGTLIFVTLIYLVRIKNPVVSIDTENFINSSSDIIYSWYSIGRFSLGLYIEFFKLSSLNMYFNNIVSLLLYFIAVILLVSDLNKEKNNYKKLVVMMLMILTSPLLAEQYAFTLQNAEVAFSYLLLVIVMKCLFKVIFKKKYIYLLGSPLLILVFGTYQSFYMMYVTLTIIYYLDNYDEKKKFKEQLKIILSYILVLIIYGILTIVTGNIINSILNVEATGYLTSQMNWFNGNFIKGILYCGYYVVSVLFGLGMDNNLGYLVLIIIILINLKKEGKKRKNIYNLALIMLLFSPFLISVLFGTITFNRAQFSIPIIMAYLYGKNLDKKYIFVISVGIILVQSISTLYLFNIDLERYNNDVKLVEYVENIENENNLPIIFIGNVSYEIKLVGEVLGKFFYNWDYKSERLSNDRIFSFMKSQGFDYQVPSTEQIKEVITEKDKYLELVNYTDKYIVINLDKYVY